MFGSLIVPSLVSLFGGLFGSKGLGAQVAGLQASRQQEASMKQSIELSAQLYEARDRAIDISTATITGATIQATKRNTATLLLGTHQKVAKMSTDLLGSV